MALDETLDMILLDTVVPKEQCIEKLKTFVKLQSEHIMYEEQKILPSIQKFLLKEDWSKLKKNGYRKRIQIRFLVMMFLQSIIN